jgi:hypothetical protein
MGPVRSRRKRDGNRTENLPVISETIATALKEKEKKRAHESEHFRMSSLGHCMRKQIAKRAGLPETTPADNRGVFKMWMGATLGKDIQALLEGEGFLEPSWTEREVRFMSYVGHVDGLTRKLPGTEEYGPAIVELKSTSDDSVSKYDWPEHYQWQALGYCLAAGVKRAVLYQFGREYGLDREKIVLVTPEWEQKITKEIRTVESYWEVYKGNGLLPPCIHRFKWEDKTCPYREPKPEKAVWNPHVQTETDRELSDFLDNKEKK